MTDAIEHILRMMFGQKAFESVGTNSALGRGSRCDLSVSELDSDVMIQSPRGLFELTIYYPATIHSHVDSLEPFVPESVF